MDMSIWLAIVAGIALIAVGSYAFHEHSRPAVTHAKRPSRIGPDLLDPAVSLARQRYAEGDLDREEFCRIMQALER